MDGQVVEIRSGGEIMPPPEWKLAGPSCSSASSERIPCPDCPYRGAQCGSRGNLRSDIVFVGEAPGYEEVRHKLPLVGPSGEVFWNTIPELGMLEEWGLDPNDFLILNALQCQPPRSKVAQVNMARVKRGGIVCRDRLLEQVARYPRKLVVAMGNHALWSLTGDYSLKITQVRGQIIESPLASIGILPVVHPAAILRGTGNYRQYRMDMLYAIDLIRGLPRKSPVETYFTIIDTEAKLRDAIRQWMKHDVLDMDIETTGFSPFSDDILCLGISYDPRMVYILGGGIRSVDRMIELEADLSWADGQPNMVKHPLLREFFKKYRGKIKSKFSTRSAEAQYGKVCWHNGKFDIAFLRELGLERAGVDEDTMLMSYSLDEQRGIHDLEQVSSDLLGAPDYKNMLRKWVWKKKHSYCRVPRKILYNYLALDVANTGGIRRILRRRVAEDLRTNKLYSGLLIPASETLYWIEHRGMPTSRFAVQRQQTRLQKVIDRATIEVQMQARRMGWGGTDINPGSPQQLKRLLFEVANIKPPKGMDKSTRKEVLAALPQTPLIKAVVEFRKAKKNKGTYADAILRNIEPATGRVHPSLLIHGTRTGRLAHKKVANIPRDKRIRGMYVLDLPQGLDPNYEKTSKWDSMLDPISGLPTLAEARRGLPRKNTQGRIFIKADLDQAELRSLAALSGDPELCAIYKSNTRKLHVEVANTIWGEGGSSKGTKGFGGCTWGEEEYMRAKALTFGIVYGRQAPSIAAEFGISEKEAQTYIDMWRTKFPVAWAFIEKMRSAPAHNQTIVTPFGRKKRHWIVTRENLNSLQNEASNFPHQAVASDIVIEAANKLRPILAERDVHIVLLVHDEILSEGPDDLATTKWAREIITAELEQAPRTWGITRIPFKADTSIGRRWGIYQGSDRKGTWNDYLREKVFFEDEVDDENADELEEVA